MLIGGFFSVDGALLLDESPGREFMLRLDTKGHYKEKIFTSNGRTASVLALQHCAKRMEGKKILLPDAFLSSVQLRQPDLRMTFIMCRKISRSTGKACIQK